MLRRRRRTLLPLILIYSYLAAHRPDRFLVAIITPYIDDLTQSVAAALQNGERKIVVAHGMGISVNAQLARPEPEQIVRFATEKLQGLSFDTLFVSCTNFRGLEAKPALEATLGVSVITSNSAVIDAIELRFASARRPFR